MSTVSEWEQGRLNGFRDQRFAIPPESDHDWSEGSQYERGYATGVAQWQKLHPNRKGTK